MKVKDAISSDSSYGFFQSLYTLFGTNYEWLTQTNAPLWDNIYIRLNSGDKTATPFLEERFDDMSYTVWTEVATYGDMLFRDKWNKLYEVMTATYNPIENYNMTQEETPDITRTRTGTNTDTIDGERTIKNEQTVSGTQENNVYGFNSTTAVPESTGTTDTTTTGLATDNVETNDETNTHDIDETETETGTRTLTRSGNIGVTTSQQMLESEIKLWEWLFFKQVFADIDSICALSVYDID